MIERKQEFLQMKILQDAGTHKILAIMAGLDGESPLQLIEVAGRTAYRSKHKITQESATAFVEMLRDRGHESVLEHSCMSVQFNNISRGFTHELVRHRLVAYTQESTRYVDESDFNVVIPPNRDANETLMNLCLPDGRIINLSFAEWMKLNEQAYRELRKVGWPPQDARQVLPTAINAPIVMTCNFREWRHVFKLRCDKTAHWEIRRVMVNLLRDVQQRIPVIFDDFQINEHDTATLIPHKPN